MTLAILAVLFFGLILWDLGLIVVGVAVGAATA